MILAPPLGYGTMSAIRIPVDFNIVKDGLASELQIVMEIIFLPHYFSDEIEKVLCYYYFLREIIGENIEILS